VPLQTWGAWNAAREQLRRHGLRRVLADEVSAHDAGRSRASLAELQQPADCVSRFTGAERCEEGYLLDRDAQAMIEQAQASTAVPEKNLSIDARSLEAIRIKGDP
jgi:hypothetical protein